MKQCDKLFNLSGLSEKLPVWFEYNRWGRGSKKGEIKKSYVGPTASQICERDSMGVLIDKQEYQNKPLKKALRTKTGRQAKM